MTNISGTNAPIKLQFCMFCILEVQNIQYYNRKILSINMAVSKFNKTQPQCPLTNFIHETVTEVTFSIFTHNANR